MTVGTQVIQVLANAKSIQANFETFALQTKDEQAQQMYANAAKEIQNVIEGLEMRMIEIEQQEPEFRRQQ